METEVATRGGVLSGMLWMAVISLLLFWLPGIGGFLAGLVGGLKAGGVANGLLAAVLPAMLLGVSLFIAASLLTGLPLVGVLAAMGGFVLAVTQVGPLLLGALAGGLLA